MKKTVILIPLSFMLIIIVFFTGCSYREDEGGVASSPVYQTVAAQEALPTITMEGAEASQPDVGGEALQRAEQLLEARLREVTGKPAFHIPASHSLDAVRQFKVLGLEDGYFYYAYITIDKNTGERVFSVARNDFAETKYQVLYERKEPIEEGTENEWSTFFCQMCSNKNGESMLSIYDDGDLVLLGTDGTELFVRTKEHSGERITELLERIFRVGETGFPYDECEIAGMVTDGRYNYYIPVNLFSDDYMELDESSDFDVSSYMMTYSFIPIGSNRAGEYLFQRNDNLENQINAWRELAENATGKRDAGADLSVARRQYPDKWGIYSISFAPGKTAQLLSWENNQKLFGWMKEPDTMINADAVQNVKVLAGSGRLENYFFEGYGQGYSSLIGKTSDEKLIQMTASRTYSVTTGEGENQATTQYTEEYSFNDMKQTFFDAGAAVEHFDIAQWLDSGSDVMWETAFSSGITADGSYGIGLEGMDRYQLYLFEKGKDAAREISGSLIGGSFEGENSSIRILNSQDGQLWLMGYNPDRKLMGIIPAFPDAPDPMLINPDDLNPSGYKNTEENSQLADGMKQSGLERKEDGDVGVQYNYDVIDLDTNPERYGAENILVLDRNKFLSTTFYNGMQLVEMDRGGKKGSVYQISPWHLYQAWLTEPGEVTAIGFDQEDGPLQTDIAGARVYVFHPEQEKAAEPSYLIPYERNENLSNEDESEYQPPTLSDEMNELWDEESRKSNESTDSGSDTGEKQSTLPQMTIFETDEALGELWQENNESDPYDESVQ